MPSLEYTALDRNGADGNSVLISGHTADTVYSFDFNGSVLSPTPDIVSNKVQSLNGNPDFTFFRYEEVWQVKTTPVLKDSTTWQNLIECLHSVRAGEALIFDPYGTVASPDNPFNVFLDGSWALIREQSSRYFSFQFNLKANENL